MAYLKTILTYHLPSEAEVDRSLLESHGITVNLLNAHTTRNELGAPFHIRLQVPDEQVEQAVALIREFNPQRFGSVERVNQIERELLGTLVRVLACMVVAGIIVYFLVPAGPGGARLVNAISYGFGLGILGYAAFSLLRRRR